MESRWLAAMQSAAPNHPGFAAHTKTRWTRCRSLAADETLLQIVRRYEERRTGNDHLKSSKAIATCVSAGGTPWPPGLSYAKGYAKSALI